jgi:hypothetical protein
MPDTRNAAETIQAAIDKLETLRPDGPPGPWASYVVVTLLRTIDAQLTILRRHLDLAQAIGPSYPVSYEDFGVLDLARAILGED